MDLLLAFSLQDQVEKYGAYVGLAAFLGLAVLSLLYFAQARELKRLRDWAGRAPERAQELEARVVAQAEEALREPEPSGTVGAAVPVAQPASGNGRQTAEPAAIPMGPRPAIAVAAAAARAAAAQSGGVATEEAPAVPATGDGAPTEDELPAADVPATAGGDGAPTEDERPAADVPATAGGDGAPAPPAEDRPAPPAEEEAAGGDRVPDDEQARSGNGVPATPPTQIPRATPRPQPRPAPAPLRAPTAARTLPPRRGVPRRPQRGDGGSRAGLYTLIGVVVLAAAIFVPVYLMLLSGDEPTPPPNPIAEPGGTPAAGGGRQAAEARPEAVVVVLNGTPVNGLASRERDKLIAAGYSDEQGMVRIDNNEDQLCQDSVVYYGGDAEQRRQARDVSRLLDITRTELIGEETQALADSSDETGSLPADVVALLCADKSP